MSGPAILLVVLLAGLVASWFLAPGLWTRAYMAVNRSRAGLKARRIDVDGVRWYYLSGGHGPTLLLLHGFGGDSSNWLPISRLLRQRFTLVIPDLPGFGNSETPESLRFDLDSQARRLLAFVESLGIDRCLIAGNSMGGYLATAFAVAFPGKVSGLWLLAPLGVREVDPGMILARMDDESTRPPPITSVSEYRRQVLPYLFATRRWVPGPLVKTLARRAIAMSTQTPRMLQEVRFESEALEALAPRVGRPSLVQWGDQDQVTNPEGLEVLGRCFPDVECALTPNCGHLPMVEYPKLCANLFVDFVERKRLT